MRNLDKLRDILSWILQKRKSFTPEMNDLAMQYLNKYPNTLAHYPGDFEMLKQLQEDYPDATNKEIRAALNAIKTLHENDPGPQSYNWK